MGEEKWKDLFGVDDWILIQKHGKSLHSKDDKQVFWETVKRMKEQDPSWSFRAHLREMIPDAKKRIAQEILDSLAHHKKEGA